MELFTSRWNRCAAATLGRPNGESEPARSHRAAQSARPGAQLARAGDPVTPHHLGEEVAQLRHGQRQKREAGRCRPQAVRAELLFAGEHVPQGERGARPGADHAGRQPQRAPRAAARVPPAQPRREPDHERNTTAATGASGTPIAYATGAVTTRFVSQMRPGGSGKRRMTPVWRKATTIASAAARAASVDDPAASPPAGHVPEGCRPRRRVQPVRLPQLEVAAELHVIRPCAATTCGRAWSSRAGPPPGRWRSSRPGPRHCAAQTAAGWPFSASPPAWAPIAPSHCAHVRPWLPPAPPWTLRRCSRRRQLTSTQGRHQCLKAPAYKPPESSSTCSQHSRPNSRRRSGSLSDADAAGAARSSQGRYPSRASTSWARSDDCCRRSSPWRTHRCSRNRAGRPSAVDTRRNRPGRPTARPSPRPRRNPRRWYRRSFPTHTGHHSGKHLARSKTTAAHIACRRCTRHRARRPRPFRPSRRPPFRLRHSPRPFRRYRLWRRPATRPPYCRPRQTGSWNCKPQHTPRGPRRKDACGGPQQTTNQWLPRRVQAVGLRPSKT